MSWYFIDKLNYILEAFKDIGKLSPEQLKKGQKLNPEEEKIKESDIPSKILKKINDKIGK